MTTSRRVPMREPKQHPARGPLARLSWALARESRLGTPERVHPIAPLTDDGPIYDVEPGDGDEIAYGMDPYRSDGCLRAAIATVTQIPIEEVPDLMLDTRLREGADPEELSRESWQVVDEWAGEHGLRIWVWSKDELPVPRGRWIGVVPIKEFEPFEVAGIPYQTPVFGDHVLIMARNKLIFNPAWSTIPPPGYRLEWSEPDRIAYGLSFDTLKED